MKQNNDFVKVNDEPDFVNLNLVIKILICSRNVYSPEPMYYWRFIFSNENSKNSFDFKSKKLAIDWLKSVIKG